MLKIVVLQQDENSYHVEIGEKYADGVQHDGVCSMIFAALNDIPLPAGLKTEREWLDIEYHNLACNGAKLFNPFTGKLRHIEDVKSDPQGILIVDDRKLIPWPECEFPMRII